MTEKEQFVELLKERTMSFAINIISFCNNLENSKSNQIAANQLIRAATSVGANYRTACRARSKSEFYSKLCIVVEEADETNYWLELIKRTNTKIDDIVETLIN